MFRVFISMLNEHVGEPVKLFGWVKKVRRVGKKLMFIELRDCSGEVQCVISEGAIPQLISLESAVVVDGVVSCGNDHRLEIQTTKLIVLGSAAENLPFVVNKTEIKAHTSQVLDFRAFSLRNERVRAVFSIQSTILNAYRNFLLSYGFTEIKTPKLVGGATETGASVFKVDYFGKDAYLAQSPQFYKQMMVGSGLERVFEIGPVFRAEAHNTSRHINEYTSLDLEMGFIEDYCELMDLEESLLNYIFDYLNKTRECELRCYDVFPLDRISIPRMTLATAREILATKYNYQVQAEDIDPEGEKLICAYAQEKFNCNAIFLTEYPLAVRPFYTMPFSKETTKSFDLLYNGLEITTGGQRIHDFNILTRRVSECGIDAVEIDYYLSMFDLGMPPHGGFAIGLERLTAQILGIENIKMATLFPRDQQRLRP